MWKQLRSYSLYLAWLIALISLVASLYSSEILHMAVCNLCWYQRIALYPLAIILGIAAYHDDHRVAKYVLPLSFIALILGFYQYLMQMIPGFAPIELCGQGPNCSETAFRLGGFITYPFLSMLASLFISILVILSYRCRLSS